jgi:acetamidase/formamidase
LSKTEIEQEESGAKPEDICVICMNPVRYGVDESGSMIQVAGGGSSTDQTRWSKLLFWRNQNNQVLQSQITEQLAQTELSDIS